MPSSRCALISACNFGAATTSTPAISGSAKAIPSTIPPSANATLIWATIAYEHEKRNEALNYIVTHPRRELHLLRVRFLTFWSGGSPAPITDFLAKHSAWFRYVLLFNLLTAVGALAGIVVLFAQRSLAAIPLSIWPLIYPWAYYLTVVEPRYRPADRSLPNAPHRRRHPVNDFGYNASQPSVICVTSACVCLQ